MLPILAYASQDHKNDSGYMQRKVSNVGEWLMQTEEFRIWYNGGGEGEGGNAVLFCYGDPGAGKTFIRY